MTLTERLNENPILNPRVDEASSQKYEFIFWGDRIFVLEEKNIGAPFRGHLEKFNVQTGYNGYEIIDGVKKNFGNIIIDTKFGEKSLDVFRMIIKTTVYKPVLDFILSNFITVIK